MKKNIYNSILIFLFSIVSSTLFAQNCTPLDKPDIYYFDSNNDGIDGDTSKAIFLSSIDGNDLNNGNINAPVATFQKALQLATAEQKDIYVGKGLYGLGTTLTIPNGISIYGQYSGAPNWSRSAANNCVVQGQTTVFAFSGNSSASVIAGLIINAADANTAGGSSYAIMIDNCSGLIQLSHNTINAGKGAAGSGGSNGNSGLSGVSGANGANGNCDANAPGAGGPAGSSSCGKNGGVGGSGSYKQQNGANGQTGSGSTTGGTGGAWGDPGKAGSSGNNGTNGSNGSSGAANSNAFNFDGNGFIPNNGQNGGDGADGNGGGGGGGGGGQYCTFCTDGSGNGGGGGGGGACKGLAGTAGNGGGASIAVWVNQSLAYLESNTITSKSGGSGGTGGNGGTGGIGGSGGNGATYCTAEVGAGGNGGKGGNGGHGGAGSGGNGGPSHCLMITGSSTVNEIVNTYTNGNGGSGGNGGTSASGNPGSAGLNGNAQSISGSAGASSAEINGTFCIEDISITRPSSGSVNGNAAVHLSVANPSQVMVDYTYSNGSAIEGTDFNLANGNLIFTGYETFKEIPLSILANPSITVDKTFTIVLSNAVGAATINRATATITIKPNAASSIQTTSSGLRYSINAWPNPFSDLTTLTYTIDIASAIEIVLYDANGKEVRTLHKASEVSGEHSILLNSNGLSQGVYFYAFRINGETVANKKLIICN